MAVELRMLTLSVVLGVVQAVAASHAASLRRGYRWSSGPRDEKVEPLRNFSETFPLFAAVVLAAHVSDTHSALAEWGARPYFWARVSYVPLPPGFRRSARSSGTSRRFSSC